MPVVPGVSNQTGDTEGPSDPWRFGDEPYKDHYTHNLPEASLSSEGHDDPDPGLAKTDVGTP